MYSVVRTFWLVVVLIVLSSTSAQAAFVTTLPSWNGGDQINPFGERNNATFGQTVTVGSDIYLNNFTFYMRSNGGPAVDFAGYAYAWDGFKATGPALYTSALTTLPSGTNTFQPVIFNVGGVALATGQQYVLFVSASNFFDGINATALLGFVGDPDPYTGGQLVYAVNDSDFGSLTTNQWYSVQFGRFPGDLAFTADLGATGPGPTAVTPLPPTLLAGFLGMAMLAGVRRLRRA